MRSLDDCFRALGLKPDCREDEIRRAYKSLVLKFHPDRGEGGKAARLREIREAYEILTDPKKYSELRQRDRRAVSHHQNAGRRAHAEVGEDWLTEDQVEKLAWDLFGWRSPNYRPMGGTLEIVLTPGEARRGGRLPLEVPVDYCCPECGGTGHYLYFICPSCGGAGSRQICQQITFDLPAQSAGPDCQEMFLHDWRLPGGSLRIILKIEG